MMKAKAIHTHRTIIRDILLILVATIVVVSYNFKGPTNGSDVTMHLSIVRVIMDSLPFVPRWNPYWYFGTPMLRVYSGFLHYSMAYLGWGLSFFFSELPMNELLSLTFLVYTYIIFFIGALSVYFLARELGIGNLGAVSAAFLFLTSFNFIGFWLVGSYPNITSILISPLSLAFYVRAAKRKNLLGALPVGFTFGIVILTYVGNALYFLAFFIVISILLLIRDPSLLYVSRTRGEPPRYTLTLPKIAGLSAVSALAFSAWWLFPFYTSVTTSSSSYAGSLGIITSVTTSRPIIDHILLISGFNGESIYTPGIGHFILVLISIILLIKLWKHPAADGVFLTLAAYFLCFTPWLGFTFSPIPSNRPPLFFSLFASLAGGFALSYLYFSYNKFVNRVSSFKSIKILRSAIPVLVCLFVLLAASFPTFLATNSYAIVVLPPWNEAMEQTVKPGERIGIDGGYDMNIASDVWQSGGGSIESMYVLNDFAYKFWYYIIYKRDARYLPYLSRNYNTRYLIGINIEGLHRTDSGFYEVNNYSSSIAEIIPQESLKVFHIGTQTKYSYLFTTAALAGNIDPILVDGGEYLEDYSAEDLGHFSLLYISELKPRNEQAYAALINSYVEGGGIVLFDINEFPPLLSEEIMNLLPIEGLYTTSSNLQLVFSPVFNCSFSFSLQNTSQAQIAYADGLRTGAEVVAWEEAGNPVIVRMMKQNGWIVWTGLNLPYQVMLNDDSGGAKLLVQLMRFLTSQETESNNVVHPADFSITSTDEYVVSLSNPSLGDGVWLKVTYYPGWESTIKSSQESLKIFLAGPHGMLVFPQQNSATEIVFSFGKTQDVTYGELFSIGFLVLFFGTWFLRNTVIRFWKIPEGWTHTHHKGSNFKNSEKKADMQHSIKRDRN